MLSNKDIRLENGDLVINGARYPIGDISVIEAQIIDLAGRIGKATMDGEAVILNDGVYIFLFVARGVDPTDDPQAYGLHIRTGFNASRILERISGEDQCTASISNGKIILNPISDGDEPIDVYYIRLGDI